MLTRTAPSVPRTISRTEPSSTPAGAPDAARVRHFEGMPRGVRRSTAVLDRHVQGLPRAAGEALPLCLQTRVYLHLSAGGGSMKRVLVAGLLLVATSASAGHVWRLWCGHPPGTADIVILRDSAPISCPRRRRLAFAPSRALAFGSPLAAGRWHPVQGGPRFLERATSWVAAATSTCRHRSPPARGRSPSSRKRAW